MRCGLEHHPLILSHLIEGSKRKKQEVLVDKGYKSNANDEVVAKHQSKNRIQDKAYRNKPLTSWQKKRNKLISKQRYKVERTFGSMKKWFKTGTCHYIGLEKTHAQHVLEAIAHNLKRSPVLYGRMRPIMKVKENLK